MFIIKSPPEAKLLVEEAIDVEKFNKSDGSMLCDKKLLLLSTNDAPQLHPPIPWLASSVWLPPPAASPQRAVEMPVDAAPASRGIRNHRAAHRAILRLSSQKAATSRSRKIAERFSISAATARA